MKTVALENDRKSFFNDRYVWLLLIIALSVRVYLSFFTCVIENDSVAFMQNAKYLANGEFSLALGHDYHPLYSFIMAIMHKVVPNIELSGTMISVTFGTLTVIVFYLIGATVFGLSACNAQAGRKISFVSALILAFHPYAVRFSADIISESTYFFFFISALGLGFFAITKRRFILFVLTGICSSLAYLTRPEGIGIIIIVVAWCALKDCVRIKALWRGKLISILILIVSFLAFSMPYLVYIKKDTGHWRLTKKKTLTNLAGFQEVSGGQHRDRLIEGEGADKQEKSDRVITKQISSGKSGLSIHTSAVLHIIKKYISTFHPFLFMFFIIGIINWAGINKERLFGLYLITVIIVYFFVLFRLCITHLSGSGDAFVYPSRRHLMPLVIPALFCAGTGVYATGIWLHGKLQNISLIAGFKELLKNTWKIQLIVLALVIVVLLPKTLKPQRFDKLGTKLAGQWIKEHSHKAIPAVFSNSARNAYYAGGKHVQMGSLQGALALAREKRADYILITYRELMVIEEEVQQSIKDNKLLLAYKYPENESLGKRNVLLYKILY